MDEYNREIREALERVSVAYGDLYTALKNAQEAETPGRHLGHIYRLRSWRGRVDQLSTEHEELADKIKQQLPQEES